MRYALIENNVVVQIDCKPRDGFVEVDNSVCCGMLYDGEHFSLPKPTLPSVQEQIRDLEAQQTPRLLREAAIGHQYALDKLLEIDNVITYLRDENSEL
tara:strand:+ start:181 stop:474 length:294 start_codon:yes stop_codon:yes gene_type:complete